MILVQILLPVADNDGVPFPDSVFRGIQAEVAARFGGLTAYSRAPAQGVWHHAGARQQDDIIIVEVMAETLDRAWWGDFRRSLEKLLRQQAIVVRAQAIELL